MAWHLLVIGLFFVGTGVLALVRRKTTAKASQPFLDRLRRIHMGAPDWVYEFSSVLGAIVFIPTGIALIVISVLS